MARDAKGFQVSNRTRALVDALLLIAAAIGVYSMLGCSHVNRTTLVASSAALACDWVQTRAAASDGWVDFEEANPIMGRTPSVNTVDAYFATAAIANAAIWYFMPSSVKSLLPITVTAFQVRTIRRNIDTIGWCTP